MSTTKKYLAELKAMRVRHALEALENPNRNGVHSGFSYGEVVGVDKGLRLAEELLEKVLKETDTL
jgi:hypothetical protein